MNTSEKFSLKFFEAIFRAAKDLSQDEIERIEKGESRIELLVDGVSKKTKKRDFSEDELNLLYERVKEFDLKTRQIEYKNIKLPKKYTDQVESRIKRTETLKQISVFSGQDIKNNT